jgi:hypothetical protein
LHQRAWQQQGGSHLLQRQQVSSSPQAPGMLSQQHQCSSSLIQEHGQHAPSRQLEPFQQRGYSSISTAGAAHYHSRHSGGQTLSPLTPAAVAVCTLDTQLRFCVPVDGSPENSGWPSSIRVPGNQPAAARHMPAVFVHPWGVSHERKRVSGQSVRSLCLCSCFLQSYLSWLHTVMSWSAHTQHTPGSK